ncbi:MAG: DNA-binding protein [Myxococcales bacterium]|nr:DNA-binding protein [Myxococcales bacterium]
MGNRDLEAGGASEVPTEIPDRAPASSGSLRLRDKQRGVTIARKQMLRERRQLLEEGRLPVIVDYERPTERTQCRHDKRPCLYVACRYHLYLDVHPRTGSIKINFPDKDVHELEETCALDVAERGGVTLEEVGEIMNLTRERIRQVESQGLEKLRDDDETLNSFLD